MKKIIITLLIGAFALPAFSSCSINSDEPCTASILDDVNTSLQDKYAPNPLDDIRKTDAFRPQYKPPYNDTLINTSSPTADYNSNCQFGVCLPEASPSQSELIE